MSLTTDRDDPELGHGINNEPVPQSKKYLVLSSDEIAKGFLKPVRSVYQHLVCGTTTSINESIAETYARDPWFYGSTYCVACAKHRPLREFIWLSDGESMDPSNWSDMEIARIADIDKEYQKKKLILTELGGYNIFNMLYSQEYYDNLIPILKQRFLSFDDAVQLKNAGLRWNVNVGDWYSITSNDISIILVEYDEEIKNKFRNNAYWLPSSEQMIKEARMMGYILDIESSIEKHNTYKPHIIKLKEDLDIIPRTIWPKYELTYIDAVVKALLWILNCESKFARIKL